MSRENWEDSPLKARLAPSEGEATRPGQEIKKSEGVTVCGKQKRSSALHMPVIVTNGQEDFARKRKGKTSSSNKKKAESNQG